MSELLVIGGASLDTLHFCGQTATSAGGAGLYTALAAARYGIQVTMLAPRPSPMPEPLLPAAERIRWLGPTITPEELPRFEIAHYGDGKSALLQATFGAEGCLGPEHLPCDLSGYDFVHIVPLGSAGKQREMLQACRERGAKRVSLGTYICAIREERAIVRSLLDLADAFFMNEAEAAALLSSLSEARARPGTLLFITFGPQGVRVLQGEHATQVPGIAAKELDPTGAGDAFCGAVLAGLCQGHHPVMAARRGVALAAQVVADVGPLALLSDAPPPEAPLDRRATVNRQQVTKVARFVASLSDLHPFPFTGPGFPPTGHPAALDFFFAATLQQFGFWEARGDRYHRPLLAPIGGALRKGSDYLWHAYLRPLSANPAFYTPEQQARLSEEELLTIFRAEDGTDPMPALNLRLAQARAYGQDMLALGLRPQGIIEQANATAMPLRTFLTTMDHIGGYKEDPLRKKTALLALILSQRPEGFLKPAAAESIPPIIDYHLMRSCLRIGLVDVVDETLYQKLVARRLLEPDEEWAVRWAAYRAIKIIADETGKDMGTIDWLFFNARHRCPEMTEPECAECLLGKICAQRKDLFQPVLRTTFY